MKESIYFISRVLCLYFFAMGFALQTQASDDKIKILSDQLTLLELFGQIERQTEYTIAYNSKLINTRQVVKLSKGEHSVVDLLNQALKSTSVMYSINKKHIILTPLSNGITKRKVSGIVLDNETGKGLSGVSISAKEGVNIINTKTDEFGKFVIEISGKTKKINISYMGYISQTVDINSNDNYTILLKKDLSEIDEVIVIGYGSLNKKEVTSAISHISSKDFNNTSSIDAAMLIQGKVSGLTVSNTAIADPSKQSTLQVRGIASRKSNSSPLIVIDGIPGGDLTNINPEDIESFDVLKDGAASAIYGTRGGHGVIMVTTKKGTKDGLTHTTYSNAFTINHPKRELDVLTPIQFRAYRAYNDNTLDRGSETDWFEAITRTAYNQKHTLSLSGGNTNSNYRITADYADINGVDIRSFREEYGARAAGNHKSSSGLFDFAVNIAPRVIYREKSDWGTFVSSLSANPTLPIYNYNGSFTDFYGLSGGSNPVEILSLDQSGTEIKLLNWDGTVKLNLLPILSPKSANHFLTTQMTFGQYQVDKYNHWFRPSISNLSKHSGNRGEASVEFDKSTSNNFEWLVNYSTSIKDHNFKVLGGYNYMYSVASGLSGENKDFLSDGLTWNSLGSGEFLAAETGRTGVASFKNDHKLIGVFARLNYDYYGKYLLSASYRREGSSRFGINNKWGNFPAISVGWRISEESFMRNIDWINELKIRADYGITGNSNISNYLSLATYRAFGRYYYQGEWFNVWGPEKNVNTDIHWEEGHNKNIGIDFTLFNQKINGSINYYHRNQKDLLGDFNVPVPPYLFSSNTVNVGTLINNGIEVDLSIDIIDKKDFSYSVTLVGASNNNKFTSFSNDIYKGVDHYSPFNMTNPGNPGPLQEIRVGQRIGTYFTYKYAGVDENGDWLIWNADNTIKKHHSSGTDEDKRVTGNGLPKFTGSWTNTFKYKNFDASIFFRGAFGFDLFNVHDFYWGLQSAEGNVLKKAYAENAHITTGKNVITEYFIEKGDYIKLEAINMGYVFPIRKKYLNQIRIYATGNNLFTWTKFSGIDPSTYEVNGITPGTFGGSNSYYPSVFQFIGGIQAKF